MSALTEPSHRSRPRGGPAPDSTKGRLLTLLKRTGGCTVDGLAAAVALAPMTVRQHLAVLERDGLVRAEEMRNGPGRPRHVYRLTERAEEAFPKRYDRLATALLHEIGELDAAELDGLTALQKQDLLLTKLAEREARRHAARLAGKPLRERVAAVTGLLQDDGGLAEWQHTDDGYEIRDYNCVYRAVAQDQPAICTWHVSLLGRLLGAPVSCEQPISRGGACCRFVICDNARADTQDAQD